MTNGDDDGDALWAVPPAVGHPSGEESGSAAGSSASVTGAPTAPAAPARRRPVGRVVAVVASAVAAGIGLVATLVVGGSSPSARPTAPSITLPALHPPPEEPPPSGVAVQEAPDGELPTAWEVTTSDVVRGTSLVLSVDGQIDSPTIVVTPDAWIVGLSQDPTFLQHVAGLDPATGETLWTYEVDRGACAQGVVDGVIACLATQSRVDAAGFASEPYTLALIDVATGSVTESPTTLTSVASLHHRPEGLLVVGATEGGAPHAALSLVAADGASVWTADVGTVVGAELLFSDFLSGSGEEPDPDRAMERVRWRDLDGGTALLWSQPGAMLIDLASGPVGDVLDCARATPAGDALYCMTYDDPEDTALTSVHRHDRSGALVWSTSGLRLAYPADSSPARPAALVGRDLVALDLATGTPGEVLHSFATPGAQAWTGDVPEPSGFGDPARAVVVGKDDAAVGLVEGADEVAWAVPIGGTSVWGVLLLDGVTVLNTSDAAVGIDPVTGAELWRRADLATGSAAAGDVIAEATHDGIARRELP